MPRADIVLDFESDRNNYLDIINTNPKYKRAKITAKSKGKILEIRIEADDTKALLSSINIMLKQLRVVNSVKSLIKKRTKND